MRFIYCVALAAAAFLFSGCSSPEKPPEPPAAELTDPEPAAPAITQLYTTTPSMPRGGKGLLCYGVENARTVWLSPPKQELSAALSRCVEVTPAETTTYTLTAEAANGQSVSKQLTVEVSDRKAAPASASRARIVEVTVSALAVKRGDALSICYQVQNVSSVRIDPIGYRGGPDAKGCAMDKPQQTTTYTITASGPGNQDTERVTVKVQ
jgi:hypothetical protein